MRRTEATGGREVGSAWKSVPWAEVLAGKVVGPRVFLRSGLIRKDLLPSYASKRMPWTAVVASAADLEAPHAVNPDGLTWNEETWVLKPSDSSNAWGIRFVETSSELSYPGENEGEVWVLQRRVEPRLLRGRCFHLRALALVVGTLDAYVYDDCRVLSAVDPPGARGVGRVTNNSRNCDLPGFDPAVHNQSMVQLIAQGLLPSNLAKSIRDLLAELFANVDDARVGAAGVGENPVSGASRKKRHFFFLPNTYELFGVDLMIDVRDRLVLLECNPEPSMGMWGDDRPIFDSCPVTQGVRRSSATRLGFTKVYSSKIRQALAEFKAAKRRLQTSSPPPAPGGAPSDRRRHDDAPDHLQNGGLGVSSCAACQEDDDAVAAPPPPPPTITGSQASGCAGQQ